MERSQGRPTRRTTTSSSRTSSTKRTGNYKKRSSSPASGGESTTKTGSYTKRPFSTSSSRYANSNSKGKRKFSSQGNFSRDGQSSGFRKRGASRNGRGGGGGRKQPSFDPSMFINKNPSEGVVDVYNAKHTFKDFKFDPILTGTLDGMGIETPSPIQDMVIPEIMKGNDVIGIAETGTGKTAAFLLPIIEKTLKEYTRQTLILTPTRELAIQIEQELWKLVKGHQIFSVTVVGGVPKRPQIMKLKKKNHFIIGTPGRILDLINTGDIKTEKVTTVVLDEADRMLDMGFISDMRAILKNTPKDRETLFFSATMDARTKGLVNEFMNDPVTVSVRKTDASGSIKQDVAYYNHSNKYGTLLNLLNDDDCTRAIVFGAMKHSVGNLARDLCKNGIKAESIHGNKTHPQRQRALKAFKSGQVKVLVATDVAARGIHVDDVSHVINYDLPQTQDDYIHRIGRTGRGAKRGEAVTLVQER